MLRIIGFTLLGFLAFAVAALLIYGLLCGVGYLALMIPGLGFSAGDGLFGTGIVVYGVLFLLVFLLAVLVAVCFCVGLLAFKSGHFVANQCVWLFSKILQRPNPKTNPPTSQD